MWHYTAASAIVNHVLHLHLNTNLNSREENLSHHRLNPVTTVCIRGRDKIKLTKERDISCSFAKYMGIKTRLNYMYVCRYVCRYECRYVCRYECQWYECQWYVCLFVCPFFCRYTRSQEPPTVVTLFHEPSRMFSNSAVIKY